MSNCSATKLEKEAAILLHFGSLDFKLYALDISTPKIKLICRGKYFYNSEKME